MWKEATEAKFKATFGISMQGLGEKPQETLREQPPSELRFEPRYSRISTETFSEATATSHEESNCRANIEPGTTEIRSWGAVHPTGTFSMLY